jgi:hypothetical protein
MAIDPPIGTIQVVLTCPVSSPGMPAAETLSNHGLMQLTLQPGITVRVSALAAELLVLLRSQATLAFIFARAVSLGRRCRLSSASPWLIPAEVSLSDSDAMMPQPKIWFHTG